MYSLQMLDKGVVHMLGAMQLGSARFHHTTQSCVQCTIYELVTSEIIPLIFLDCG